MPKPSGDRIDSPLAKESGGGGRPGTHGVIQSGEARGRISLVFPSNPPSGSQSWNSIIPLLECPESSITKKKVRNPDRQGIAVAHHRTASVLG